MYLIDTDVLSALRKLRRDHQVVAWFESIDTDTLFIGVITLMEIERGIEKQQRVDPTAARTIFCVA
jgi:toxin FitB